MNSSSGGQVGLSNGYVLVVGHDTLHRVTEFFSPLGLDNLFTLLNLVQWSGRSLTASSMSVATGNTPDIESKLRPLARLDR